MTSRERIAAACSHLEPDGLPVDFGGGFQTGMHVSVVYRLRQALGLDRPGVPVKVVEVYQMLGEIASDLADALGIDTVSKVRRQVTRTSGAESSPRWARNESAVTFVRDGNLFLVFWLWRRLHAVLEQQSPLASIWTASVPLRN